MFSLNADNGMAELGTFRISFQRGRVVEGNVLALGRLTFQIISDESVATRLRTDEVLWFGFGDSQVGPQTLVIAFDGLKEEVQWPDTLWVDAMHGNGRIRRFEPGSQRETAIIELQFRDSRLTIHLTRGDDSVPAAGDNETYGGYLLP